MGRIILKILKYAVLAVVLFVVGILILSKVLPPAEGPRIAQTMSAGGKTVHLASGGQGEVNISATMEGDGSIVVNGQKIDLSGGDIFTVLVFPDGRMELHKGTP